MAKRRRRRTAATTTTRRRRRRHNPSRARTIARRVGTRARGAFAGLNFKGALKEVPMELIGMFSAKWAAKRFGNPATETDPASWNAASYIKGALGAVGGGILMNMIKPGSGHDVLRGGLSLMAYKLIENKGIANSPFWSAQLGADESAARVPGVIEMNGLGEPFILGEDYQWRPLNGADDYRAISGYGADEYVMGDALVRPGPLGAEEMYGDALVRPGPLGAEEMYGESLLDRSMGRSFLRR
ncbi:MAG: hypothetical protein A2Y72_07745 [Chloroflexi bacterium RBG_13_53_26]|nr:MAG: hypothetical protein A2Y72_07745 [Chloroflexi bacterium RBG_13_53_26]